MIFLKGNDLSPSLARTGLEIAMTKICSHEKRIQDLESKIKKLCSASETAIQCFNMGTIKYRSEGLDPIAILTEAIGDKIPHIDFGDGIVTLVTYSEDGEIYRQTFKKSEMEK